MARIGMVACLALAAMVTCGGPPDTAIDRQTFEDVMVELRKAVDGVDSVEFAERRREILEASGVTDSLLFAFVRAHEGDLDYMSQVWESIDARVNEPSANASDTLTVR